MIKISNLSTSLAEKRRKKLRGNVHLCGDWNEHLNILTSIGIRYSVANNRTKTSYIFITLIYAFIKSRVNPYEKSVQTDVS